MGCPSRCRSGRRCGVFGPGSGLESTAYPGGELPGTAAWCQLGLGRLEVHAGRPSVARPLLAEALDWLTEAGIQSIAYEAQLATLAADLADGRSGDVLSGAAALEPQVDTPTALLGRLDVVALPVIPLPK